jgi:hypothetical protein
MAPSIVALQDEISSESLLMVASSAAERDRLVRPKSMRARSHVASASAGGLVASRSSASARSPATWSV